LAILDRGEYRLQTSPFPTRVNKRVTVHFPGFEPLDAAAHMERYRRTAAKTAAVWGFEIAIDDLKPAGRFGVFNVESSGEGWRVSNRMYCLHHNDIISALNKRANVKRMVSGYKSALSVIAEGAAFGYFRYAWRFGLFFVFPFVLVLAALLASGTIALYPLIFSLPFWHFLIALPAAWFFFSKLFLPWSERFYTLHLFSDWDLAVAVAREGEKINNNPLGDMVADWIADAADSLRLALSEEADEYVITAHSMGASLAAHALGKLAEDEPQVFAGKRVVFSTLGGAILQCSLFRSANILRRRVGAIARQPQIFWFEVQCLTDAVNFYKCPVVALCGHKDAPQPKITFIRLKNMLTPERYKKIKRDMMRVHRQYVLDADYRSLFDFALMTTGPLPAEKFAGFSANNLPEI
jgi:hypothetical protein